MGDSIVVFGGGTAVLPGTEGFALPQMPSLNWPDAGQALLWWLRPAAAFTDCRWRRAIRKRHVVCCWPDSSSVALLLRPFQTAVQAWHAVAVRVWRFAAVESCSGGPYAGVEDGLQRLWNGGVVAPPLRSGHHSICADGCGHLPGV